MKPQYQHLKLIIECPTQEAWDKVTEFFGIESSTTWDDYREVSAIRIGAGERRYTDRFGIGTVSFYDNSDAFDHKRLTYPQFCERFLNSEIISNNRNAFGAITEILNDVVEPVINSPEDIKAIREKLLADFDELVNDLKFDNNIRPVAPEDIKTRLYRDLNPICDVRVHEEDLTVYDRVSVNEDVLID